MPVQREGIQEVVGHRLTPGFQLLGVLEALGHEQRGRRRRAPPRNAVPVQKGLAHGVESEAANNEMVTRSAM